MSLDGITELEIINGIFNTIITVVSMIVGLRLSFKYRKHKIKELLTVGISWMLIFTHWWGNSFSFLLYVFFGYVIELSIYLFIENIFMPLALFLWLYSFCSLMYPRFLKVMIIICMPLCILEGFYIFLVLLIKPEIFATMRGIFDTDSSITLLTLKIPQLMIFAITSLIYGTNLIFEADEKIRLKGILLLIGIGSYLIGGLYSTIHVLSLLELSFNRLILISSSIEFYLSVFLPNRISHWIIKEIKGSKTSIQISIK